MLEEMNAIHYNILLADDDADDCLFFKEALDELPFSFALSTVNNGSALMQLLPVLPVLPDVLFLDLNMPLKNGMECLTEIRSIERYKALPAIIFSTSYDTKTVDLLFRKGASYYIRKPGEFPRLREMLHRALNLVSAYDGHQPPREKFVLSAD